MNLDFLDDIVAWAEHASLIMQAAVKVLTMMASWFPVVALKIISMVSGFFDLFEKKEKETGEPVPKEEKRDATETIVSEVLNEYHGSGSLISESWIRGFTGFAVFVLKAMRYGEDAVRNEKAVLKGYMSTSEDVQRAANTHAGFKLFGA